MTSKTTPLAAPHAIAPMAPAAQRLFAESSSSLLEFGLESASDEDEDEDEDEDKESKESVVENEGGSLVKNEDESSDVVNDESSDVATSVASVEKGEHRPMLLASK